MEAIVRHPVRDQASWRGAQLHDESQWRVLLTPAQVTEIDAALDHCAARGLDLFSIGRDDFPLPGLTHLFDQLSSTLEGGRGFVCLRGLPVDRWGELRSRCALWGLGSHLGWAEIQDAAGSLMHDVRDVGQPFGANDTIRYFQTSEAIDFHNDGADVFALMCLKGGMIGGRSRLVSAVALFNEILRRQPDLAEVLQKPFHFDTRGQHPQGALTQQIPIYAFADGALTIIMKSMYIKTAQRFAEVPRLSEAQQAALALLDSIPEEPGMALEFDLCPGDILIANNHTVLHGRTAFTNHGDSSEHRHLLRLWLTIANGRMLPPHYANTREFGPTYARRISGAA